MTDATIGNAEAGAKLAGRTGIRVGLAPFDLMVSGMRALGREFDRVPGLTSQAPQLIDTNGQPIGGASTPLPSEAAIQDASKAVPLQMDTNASPAMKFADVVAPIAFSGITKGVTSASSIPGMFGGALKETAKQGAGAAAATAGGALASYLGADDLGTLLASIASGGAILKGIQGWGTQKIANRYGVGKEEARQTLDDAPSLGVKPTFGMLATPEGKMLEANLAANPLVGGGIKAQMADVQNTLNNRISQEAGNVGYGGTPLAKPRDPTAMGADLTSEAQARQAALNDATSQSYDALRAKIGNTPPDLKGLADQISGYAVHPDTAPEWTPALEARARNVNAMAERGGGYSALQDSRSLLGKSLAGADALEGKPYSTVYGHMTDTMRDTADRAGAAADFDVANERARVMHQEQFPPLQALGGELGSVNPFTGRQQFNNAPSAGAASGIFERAASTEHSGDPELMRQIDEHMQGGAVGRALADIIRNAGYKSGDFRLEHFAPAWEGVNEQARSSIGNRSAETPATLDKVARLSDVFLRKPATSGLTDTLGLQAAMAMLPGNWATKTAGAMALMRCLNSNSMLNAMAGRGGLADLLTPYLQNLPVQQQTTQRVVGRQ
jgi:hypothetical protein